MSDVSNILGDELVVLTEQANRTVRKGAAVQGVLANEVVVEFFDKQTRDLAKLLLEVDTSNVEALRSIITGIKAISALHTHLTQAVTDGLSAAMRLSEQAKQGEVR